MPSCRYSTKVLMKNLFKSVAEHWREKHFGKGDCAKWFVERGGELVSSGVEGGYTPDGVQHAHLFMLRAESPTDLAMALLQHKVSGLCG